MDTLVIEERNKEILMERYEKLQRWGLGFSSYEEYRRTSQNLGSLPNHEVNPFSSSSSKLLEESGELLFLLRKRGRHNLHSRTLLLWMEMSLLEMVELPFAAYFDNAKKLRKYLEPFFQFITPRQIADLRQTHISEETYEQEVADSVELLYIGEISEKLKAAEADFYEAWRDVWSNPNPAISPEGQAKIDTLMGVIKEHHDEMFLYKVLEEAADSI